MTSTDELRQMHTAHVRAERGEHAATHAEFEQRHAASEIVRQDILACTTAATPQDYGRFLAQYLRAGGQPTHFYDYPMDRWTIRVVAAPLEIGPLYGAQGLSLIVPAAISVTGAPGHIHLFRMDEPLGSRIVPIFSDSVVADG